MSVHAVGSDKHIRYWVPMGKRGVLGKRSPPSLGSSPLGIARTARCGWRLPVGRNEGRAVSQTHDLARNLRHQFPREVVAHAGVADESCTGNGARQS
jgi:hypothetical protein